MAWKRTYLGSLFRTGKPQPLVTHKPQCQTASMPQPMINRARMPPTCAWYTGSSTSTSLWLPSSRFIPISRRFVAGEEPLVQPGYDSGESSSNLKGFEIPEVAARPSTPPQTEILQSPGVSLAQSVSVTGPQSGRVKPRAKRKPYSNMVLRQETGLTRQLRGCMRCRRNRARVSSGTSPLCFPVLTMAS